MNETNEVELARLRLGSYIVGGSILAVVLCLMVVVSIKGNGNTTDMVALLGGITTFLGAVVGVFFGVNASGSNHAQSAATAAEANQAAGKVADAARSVSESARQVSETASRSIDASHAFFRDAAARGFGSALTADVQAQPAPFAQDVEDLAGDPDDEHTRMVLSGSRAFEAFTRGVVHLTNAAPADILFSKRVVAVADGEAAANVSRTTNEPRVTEYLNLLGLNFLDENGVPTRYCATGVTWATCKAYCDLNGIQYTEANRLAMLKSVLGDIGRLYFKPSAGCQSIMDDAKARGTFLPNSQTPQPGYLVFYNWSGASHAEHIGIVEGRDANGIQTVEFNTQATSGPNQGNGGAVSKKVRPLKFVLGYAKTY